MIIKHLARSLTEVAKNLKVLTGLAAGQLTPIPLEVVKVEGKVVAR
jgi:hypothetical protein